MGVLNRKIDPSRRMQRQHPFDVWRVLYALKMRDELIEDNSDNSDRDFNYYSPAQVAKILYTNYDDFSDHDCNRVIRLKLECAFRCLKHTCFVEERTVTNKVDVPYGYFSEYKTVGLGVYRARQNVFAIPGWTREQTLEATKSALDKDWGIYIGRRGAWNDHR